MKFLFLNYSIIIILLTRNKVLSFNRYYCSSFENGPQIKIYSAGSPAHFPSVKNVELVINHVYQQKNIECLYSSPIDFVTNINQLNEDQFEIRRNFYQRKNSSFNNGNNQREISIQYSVYIMIMYKPDRLKAPLLFSCQPIKLKNECERTFLEIQPQTYSAIFTVFYSTSQISQTLQALSRNLLIPMKIGNKPFDQCAIVLYIKETSDNGLEYKWTKMYSTASDTSEIIQMEKVFITNQGIVFRNSFRLIQQERNCVKILNSAELCNGCSKIQEKIINSVVFYAESGDNQLAFKGVFNISNIQTGIRKFYLEWDVPLEEMVQLEIPPIFYVNQTMQISCSVSVLYFAYGTIISTEYESYRDSPLDELEVYKSDGRRQVFRNITLENGDRFEKIICSAPLWNYSGVITKSKTFYVEHPAAPRFTTDLTIDQVNIIQPSEINQSISCEAFGKPVPNLEWKVPNQNIISSLSFLKVTNTELNFTKSIIIFPEFSKDFLGIYNCVASNYLGTISRTYNLQFEIGSLSTVAKAGISSAFGALLLVFLVIIGLVYRKIIIQRQEYRTKTAEAILEFKKGKNKELSENKGYSSILEQPYNDKFEVPVEKWNIDDQVLGQGAFGFVRKGTVQLENDKAQVIAIKMLKSSVEIDDFKGFLTELKIMAYIGQHPYVVSLVAACTQNIDQRSVMIGVEFCSNGSLLDYLLSKRGDFQGTVCVGQDRENTPCTKWYANVDPDVNSDSLTEKDLFVWAYQIASGMEFLSSKRILHGDLATRNILLSSDKTAKIADFGFSRFLIDSANYTKKSRVPLPWKWLSLEVLKFLNFSTASDVWAYGVTIWEIFSLGEVPFAGLHYSPEFIDQLENGLQLPKPARATEYTYNIMRHCWNPYVSQRATFPELTLAFSQILESFNCNVPSKSPVLPLAILEHNPVTNPQVQQPNPWYYIPPNSNKIYNLYLDC